ncbi:MAG: 16S rRNA (cytosine(967)-C(5))-methyltransferase RsmB [Deltaproteobacteria bacterium HGW-Deltaproteobacteria-23]|jgi:16S rRNA (cytosine967-C5)-methyltransferase|nr:MAG: 16S rRNA (cytosine(967)-C(5))-methyltransferase RsmB [Deltaproteobacteria bacterium HGW-Deltaproteobacteria-23]
MTTSPRQAAYLTLLRIEKERSYADILIDQELQEGGLSGPDRGLYTELVYGTLRKQGTLDHIMSQFSNTPLGKLERSVILLLRLGLYQMFFLDRIPVSAAVNETVNLAKQYSSRSAGFINAVLRSADRGRDTVSYPDPDKAPAAWLAAKHSQPLWIAEGWLEQLGLAEATKLAAAMSVPPPFTIRANRLKTSRDSLIKVLQAEGVVAVPCQYAPDGLTVTSAISLAGLKSFHDGLFAVQDEASQLAALLLSPQPGDAILDLCAAPGGKATYLAELTGDHCTLTACDRNPRKLALIREVVERLDIKSITVTLLDATKPLEKLGNGLFDRILVDAPCSGLGVIHRNPEGKWWKEPSDPMRLAITQRAILANAALRLKPGGVMVYSTCSTSLEENEQVVENFLKQQRDFMIEPVSKTVPQTLAMQTEQGFFRSWLHKHAMDGFFAARLIKVS